MTTATTTVHAGSGAPTDRTRVLFVTYGGAHIAKVAPVVRELERRGVECVVLALTLGFKQALRFGLRPLGYKDFMQLVDDPQRALEVGRSLLGENSHPDVDPHESACYLGVNYLEWVAVHGEQAAKALYAQGGRRAFKPVRFMSKVLAQLRPDAVVSTSSPRSEQAVIEAAVEAGIPSVTMMDSFALPADPYHKHRVRADCVTVMSAQVKSNLIAMGMDANRIRVTGCPGFDGHFSPSVAEAARAFRVAHGWDQLSVVLWAGGLEESPGTPQELAGSRLALAVEEELRAYVRKREHCALIIRYHPNEYHLFNPVLDQARVYVSNPSEESIELMVKVADAVVVQASTVGVEAALAGKRVLALTYSPSVKWSGLDYAAMGYAEAAPTLACLIRMLGEGVTPKTTQAAALSARRAAPAVAEVIIERIQARCGSR